MSAEPKSRRWPLRQYLLATMGLVLFSQLISGGLIIRAGLDIAGESVSEGSRVAAQAMADNVVMTFNFARRLIVAGSKRPGLLRFLKEDNDEQVQAVVDVIISDTPYYSAVYALKPDLTPVRGAPRAPAPSDYARHVGAFRQVLETHEAYVSEPERSAFTQHWVVIVAAAATLPTGESVGLLVGEVSLPKVAADLTSLRYGDQGYPHLVTADGLVLASPVLEPGIKVADFAAGLAQPRNKPFRYVTPAGEAMQGTWAGLSYPPWSVIVAQPESQAVQKVRSLRNLTLGLLLMGLVLVLTAGLLAVRLFADPLRRVSRVASQITAGDLAQRVPSSVVTEFAALGQAFNEMADRLTGLVEEARGQNRELEARVAQRTAELASAKDAAEDANRAKGEFLANMSEELLSPLNGVLSMCDSLLDSPLTPSQRDAVQSLASSASSLRGIIDDILEGSKVEAGRLALERIAFDPSRTVEEVAASLAPQAHKKGLAFVAEVAPSVPARLWGDPLRLRQVLMNVVGNAVKFTTHGEVDLFARLDAEGPGFAVLRVDVVDTGPGLSAPPPAAAASEPPVVPSPHVDGMGWGLAVAARLATLMGGRIDVESEPGAGRRITLRLRLERQAQSSTSAPAFDQSLAGRRALCVEGHATSRHVLTRLLADLAIEADAYASPDTALAAISSSNPRFDVALLDDAAAESTLVAQLRALAGHAELPIVVMNQAGLPVPDAVRALVAVTLVTKPLRRGHLHDCLKGLLVDLADPTPQHSRRIRPGPT